MFSWGIFKWTLKSRGFEQTRMRDPKKREYVTNEREVFGWNVKYQVLAEERAFYDLENPENNNRMLVFTLTYFASKSGQVARKVIHVHEMMVTDNVITRELADEFAEKFGETVFCEEPTRCNFEMLDVRAPTLDVPIGDD